MIRVDFSFSWREEDDSARTPRGLKLRAFLDYIVYDDEVGGLLKVFLHRRTGQPIDQIMIC